MKRTWLPIMASAAIDAVLAIFMISIFRATNKVLAFTIVFASISLILAIFQFWNTIKFWILYKIINKNRIVRYYTSTFYKNNFPDPSVFFDGKDYLASVSEDEEEDSATKNATCIMLGEINAAKTIAPFSLGLSLDLSLDEALKQYNIR